MPVGPVAPGIHCGPVMPVGPVAPSLPASPAFPGSQQQLILFTLLFI